MNKNELIEIIAKETEVSKNNCEKVLNSLLKTIKETVKNGETVQLIGFGNFSSDQRAARTGRNPKTGEPIEIASYRVVKFTAGKAFKDLVK